eukprot:CAMPEP_0206456386 /NCGR_PEP_ID=MMETSP0324_2-20121206/22341_1 /ASSEMBLY_ACC=CAM_ASM_000836 /TAXON_ID=2866 /ORGANISM="Crypthecodinium cohnii, Strain Seligo" /LENGTH=409 /DNA_ID=CAMNT_0053927319 /DNA_START=106 /DNA_END=1332 /DNA_ORIENTATION=-
MSLQPPATLAGLCHSYKRFCDRQEGTKLVWLLDPDRGAQHAIKEMLPKGSSPQAFATKQGGPEYGEALGLYLGYLHAKINSEAVRELELLCTCTKTWVQLYMEAPGTAVWMTPLMMHLCNLSRRTCIALDEAKRQQASTSGSPCLTRLVEIHRDLFQKLNKEREKRAGHVWVCCELLRAYFKLGQISQGSFLLNALNQSQSREDFRVTDLPKAIAVTFFFYWGKQSVFTHNLKEADDKLSWAFEHCPPTHRVNRRKILLYLVPCKLRLGVLPRQDLLKSNDLYIFTDIVQSIREGNVQVFNRKMEEHAADFIKMGTFLIMMKLKFTVMRSLVKGVHREVRKSLPKNADHKMDLTPFEQVFDWQDACDPDETACMISSLIYQNAVKGYLSHEHRKIVFAKDTPFPAPSAW